MRKGTGGRVTDLMNELVDDLVQEAPPLLPEKPCLVVAERLQ